MALKRNIPFVLFIMVPPILAFALSTAQSHTLPLSYLTLVPDTNYLHVELTLNPFELSFFEEVDANRNGRLDPTEWEDEENAIVEKILGCLDFRVDGRRLKPETSGLSPDLDTHHATVRAHYPADIRQVPITVQSSLATLTSGSHFTQVTYGTEAQPQVAQLDNQSATVTFTPPNSTNLPAANDVPTKVADPPDEMLRVGLPVLVILIFVVFGWYAKNKQRQFARSVANAKSGNESNPKTNP